jgi:hypothetical protein
VSVRDDVKAILAADATFLAAATGGIYAGGQISRQLTPNAFDANSEIKPCALVNEETAATIGPFTDAALTMVRIFFYQRIGYDSIDAMMERAFALLQQDKPGGGYWQIDWENDVKDQIDQALGCSLAMSRYSATIARGWTSL